MKKLDWKIFISVFVGVALSGCDKPQEQPKSELSRQIEGQAFIVTEGRENMKLGLLPIYVADKKIIRLALRALEAEEFKAMKEEARIAVERAAFNSEFRDFTEELTSWTQFSRDSAFDAEYVGACLSAIDDVSELLRENTSRSGKGENTSRSGKGEKTADRFFQQLEKMRIAGSKVSMGKTDADGKFSISFVAEEPFICAQSTRKVGDEEEFYFWLHQPTSYSKEFLGNDTAIDSRDIVTYFTQNGGWDFPPVEVDISYRMRKAIAKCNQRLDVEKEKLEFRIEERKKAAAATAEANKKAAEAEEERQRLVEEAAKKMRIAEEKDEKPASKIELFSERLERLKKQKLEDPDQLLGFVELVPMTKPKEDKNDPFSAGDDDSLKLELSLRQLTFRLSKTEKGKPHEKRSVLRKILARLNTNLEKFGKESFSESQFVKVVRAGIPVQVYIEGTEKCGGCFGDGQLGRIQGFKTCKTCAGLGTQTTRSYYKVTWN